MTTTTTTAWDLHENASPASETYLNASFHLNSLPHPRHSPTHLLAPHLLKQDHAPRCLRLFRLVHGLLQANRREVCIVYRRRVREIGGRRDRMLHGRRMGLKLGVQMARTQFVHVFLSVMGSARVWICLGRGRVLVWEMYLVKVPEDQGRIPKCLWQLQEGR